MNLIPNTIHYIFGIDGKCCNKPLCNFHAWNIQLSKIYNPECEIMFHFLFEPPPSPTWDIIKKTCILNKISIDDINFGIDFKYSEHIVDLCRLHILKKYGGIYLDIDVACVKSFRNLLHNKCVMGIEIGNSEIIGLCNAVILSEINSEFINIWINEFYNDYREQWEYNCVRMPYNLSLKYPSLIHTEPVGSFFKFSWDNFGQQQLFEELNSYDESYCIHLWEHKNYEKLSNINTFTKQSTISKIYEKFIGLL